ncbi:MAG: patatin-like phospholipase family protein [Cyanobacteria bacterium P01_E01_bin.6]
MTEKEKADIREKLSEPAEDGHIYADAVFEGGGVKGTAFIGAMRCFDDVGIKWRKLAGTSVGAITAAMLATGLSMDALEEIVAHLDYRFALCRGLSGCTKVFEKLELDGSFEAPGVF